MPVDLDEILPASKQKKLVLPSLHRTTSSGSLRRASHDSRAAPTATTTARSSSADGDTTKRDSADTTAGGGSKPRPPSKKKKTPSDPTTTTTTSSTATDPERRFDLVSARQVCTLTDAALGGMTDAELAAHVARLDAMRGTAEGVLAYWQRQADGKIGDREAFEGVIENLVKHARKVRK